MYIMNVYDYVAYASVNVIVYTRDVIQSCFIRV